MLFEAPATFTVFFTYFFLASRSKQAYLNNKFNSRKVTKEE